jgi:hypothetical protein
VEFSWAAWIVSVSAVVISGVVAWLEGNFTRSARLDMGFANHGGMWGDVLLLPVANAAIIPHVTLGAWVTVSLVVCALLSAWVHVHWYRGDRTIAGLPASVDRRSSTRHSREHMWPSRPYGSWWKDLSGSGWAHVIYVACELTLLVGFLLFPMPDETVALVAAIFSLHVPLGLLQPRWFVTGDIAPRRQPLLMPCLAALWTTCLMKVV